jgi:hypothetical protein
MTDDLNAWREQTDGRLLNHGTRILDVEEQLLRSRQRLHDLESDRNAVRLLTGTIGALAEQVSAMAQGVDDIAERAVEKVIKRHTDERRANWKHKVAMVSAVAAAAGGTFSFIAHLFHLHF